MELYFASHNAHKLVEIQRILPSFIALKNLDDLGLTEEIVEDGETIEQNSKIKASYVFQEYEVACFADDTGLEVNALDGEPGVFSARYAGEEKNSDHNMDLLLEKLRGHTDRTAQFKTVITLIMGLDELMQFEGIVKGKIIDEKQGIGGFGYDPIFVPDGYDVTFAEMGLSEKNKISHRALAFQKLIAHLQKLTS
ncbi:MAG: XTP/dITP diphosphohydrolase [Cyclobacteriaceae bacterium]|jgi:XTP/dITP diphosphohydrolase